MSKHPLLKGLTLLLALTCLYVNSPAAGLPGQVRGVGVGPSAQGPSVKAGRYHALVIGNNNYQFWRKLNTAEADARAVSELLRTRFGFETRLLLNATRGQIIVALNEYRRRLSADDSLLVYYAGHGVVDLDKAYWVPVDAGRDDNVNWIIADDVTTNVKGIPARHVLVVSDSCYSGALSRGEESGVSRPDGRDRYLRRMGENRSRTLMASGGNEPVADGGGGRHSVFAGALLRALGRIDQDVFTAEELFYGYVREAVTGGSEQTPEYQTLRNSGHEGGDFIFMLARPVLTSGPVTPPAAVKKTEPAPAPLVVSRPAPRSAAALEGEAERLLRANDNQGAIRTAGEALGLDASARKSYRLRGAAYFNSGETVKGDEDAARVLALPGGPRSAADFEARGWAYFVKNEYDLAVADFNLALSLDPQYALAYYTRGNLFFSKKDYARAAADFTRVISLDPRFTAAYSMRGSAHNFKREYEAAIADFTLTLALDPQYVLAYYNRGNAYFKKQQYERAVADYTQALNLAPTWASAYNNRGNAYSELGDHGRAINDFTQAIKLDPAYSRAYSNRAVAYEKLGDSAKARADWDKAAEIERQR